jgi:uncharacterized phage protein gp47/JayE
MEGKKPWKESGMAFDRPSLSTLLTRVEGDYSALFSPVAKTPRYNLLHVLAKVSAGNAHLLHGDLAFLAEQIFPDTATGAYLRAHWSDRVPPKTASTAVGYARFPGTTGEKVPAGMLLQSNAGESYFVVSQGTVLAVGYARCQVQAVEAGSDANLDGGASLAITSTKPEGLNSTATVEDDGITGGVDAETDAAYLTRVLAYAKTGARYGKKGDFAAWAQDATAEVTKAFEIKNFGPWGALLIQVIGGNQTDGVTQVTDLDSVTEYIDSLAPPVPFKVRTPELISINPTVTLLSTEDTTTNRAIVKACLQAYLQTYAKPGWSVVPETLRASFVDGSTITGGSIALPSNPFTVTSLQYPILGDITWG